jgi:hypothetical protein
MQVLVPGVDFPRVQVLSNARAVRVVLASFHCRQGLRAKRTGLQVAYDHRKTVVIFLYASQKVSSACHC